MEKNTISVGWFIAACIGLAICLTGWIGAGNRVTDLTKAAEEREQAVQELKDDANSKYNDLLETAKNAKSSVTEQCDWLSDNISGGVAEYCQEAADQFDESNFDESPFSDSYEDYQYPIDIEYSD